eukprot:403365265
MQTIYSKTNLPTTLQNLLSNINKVAFSLKDEKERMTFQLMTNGLAFTLENNLRDLASRNEFHKYTQSEQINSSITNTKITSDKWTLIIDEISNLLVNNSAQTLKSNINMRYFDISNCLIMNYIIQNLITLGFDDSKKFERHIVSFCLKSEFLSRLRCYLRSNMTGYNQVTMFTFNQSLETQIQQEIFEDINNLRQLSEQLNIPIYLLVSKLEESLSKFDIEIRKKLINSLQNNTPTSFIDSLTGLGSGKGTPVPGKSMQQQNIKDIFNLNPKKRKRVPIGDLQWQNTQGTVEIINNISNNNEVIIEDCVQQPILNNQEINQRINENINPKSKAIEIKEKSDLEILLQDKRQKVEHIQPNDQLKKQEVVQIITPKNEDAVSNQSIRDCSSDGPKLINNEENSEFSFNGSQIKPSKKSNFMNQCPKITIQQVDLNQDDEKDSKINSFLNQDGSSIVQYQEDYSGFTYSSLTQNPTSAYNKNNQLKYQSIIMQSQKGKRRMRPQLSSSQRYVFDNNSQSNSRNASLRNTPRQTPKQTPTKQVKGQTTLERFKSSYQLNESSEVYRPQNQTYAQMQSNLGKLTSPTPSSFIMKKFDSSLNKFEQSLEKANMSGSSTSVTPSKNDSFQAPSIPNRRISTNLNNSNQFLRQPVAPRKVPQVQNDSVSPFVEYQGPEQLF